MATLPTEAQAQAEAVLVMAKWKATRAFGASYVALHNAISDGTYPDNALAVEAAIAAARAALEAMLLNPLLRNELLPILQSWQKVLTNPSLDPATMYQNLYQRMVDSAQYVLSRGVTFGSIAAGANQGNGTILRLTVDENGFAIDSVTPETKRLTCVSDEHSGAVLQQEVFRLEGEAVGSILDILGSGQILRNLTALSGKSTSTYLTNPSFDVINGGSDAVPDEILGWTISDIANVEVGRNTGEFYRSYQGVTDPGGLLLKDDELVSQSLRQRNVQVNPAVPMYLQIAVKRLTGADGTGTLRLGAVEHAVSIPTLTVDEWTIIRIGPSTENWFKNWNEDNPAIEFEWAGRTAGQMRIDDVVFGPWTAFDSSWWAAVGGDSPFLRDDNFSVNDTSTEAGEINYWMWRAAGVYFPHDTGSTVTWVGP